MKKNSPLNIKLLSIGGRGANILERLASLDLNGIERIAIGVPSKVFSRVQVNTKIELRKEAKVVETALNEKVEEIEKSLAGADVLFMVGNLANETSHIQIAKIAEMAKQKGTLTFFVGATPFAFEGATKIQAANQNRLYIEQFVDAVIMLDSAKIIAENISAVEAFTKIDATVSEVITSILDLVTKFGVINVDFADLKTTVQNAGEIFFNSINGSKQDIQKLTDDLFTQHQFAISKNSLGKILYVIYAGKDILMEEIRELGENLQKHFTEQSRVIFGVVSEEESSSSLRVVLIGA